VRDGWQGKGWGEGGEMTQELYAHMNNKKKRRPRETSTYQKDSWSFNTSNCPKTNINILNQPTYVLDHFHQSFPCTVFTLSFINKDLWICIYSLLNQLFFHLEQELSPQQTRVTRIDMPILLPRTMRRQKCGSLMKNINF
jgi:hypothetical protein